MGKGQRVLRQGPLDGLVEAEVDGPVVAGLKPGSKLKGGQPTLGDGHQGLGGGIGQDQVVRFGAAEEQLAYLRLVGGGAQRHVDIETPYIVGVQVLDGGVGQSAVGQCDLQIVGGGDDGVEHGDLFHRALMGAVADIVAQVEGPEDHEHDAARKIGERPLQRQAYSEAAGTEDCQNGGGGHAHGGDGHHDDQGIPQDLQGAGKEGLHLGGELLEGLALPHQLHDLLHQPQTDDQDEQGRHDVHGQLRNVGADQSTQVHFP